MSINPELEKKWKILKKVHVKVRNYFLKVFLFWVLVLKYKNLHLYTYIIKLYAKARANQLNKLSEICNVCNDLINSDIDPCTTRNFMERCFGPCRLDISGNFCSNYHLFNLGLVWKLLEFALSFYPIFGINGISKSIHILLYQFLLCYKFIKKSCLYAKILYFFS